MHGEEGLGVVHVGISATQFFLSVFKFFALFFTQIFLLVRAQNLVVGTASVFLMIIRFLKQNFAIKKKIF